MIFIRRCTFLILFALFLQLIPGGMTPEAGAFRGVGSSGDKKTIDGREFKESGKLKVSSFKTSIHDSKRKKELELVVTYPLVSRGKFPVIVFSHGAFGSGGIYSPLVNFWVSHGYVCIQPTHEDSIRVYGRDEIRRDIVENGLDPKKAFTNWKAKSFANWKSRPQDISLILDSLDEIQAMFPDGQRVALDTKNVAVGGHSFGAHTSQIIGGTIIGGTQDYADQRARAILLISPQGIESGRLSAMTQDSWRNFKRPMMLITGTNDTGRGGQDYTWRLAPYNLSPHSGNKTLVVIKKAYHGFGGINTANLKGSGPKNDDHLNYVRGASLAFFDQYLKRSKVAKQYLEQNHLEKASRGNVYMSCK